MTCNHKWVMYQPFTGDSYECCALAGCGIRKDQYERQLEFQSEDLRPKQRTYATTLFGIPDPIQPLNGDPSNTLGDPGDQMIFEENADVSFHDAIKRIRDRAYNQ